MLDTITVAKSGDEELGEVRLIMCYGLVSEPVKFLH